MLYLSNWYIVSFVQLLEFILYGSDIKFILICTFKIYIFVNGITFKIYNSLNYIFLKFWFKIFVNIILNQETY